MSFDTPSLFSVRNLVASEKMGLAPKMTWTAIKKACIRSRRKTPAIEASVARQQAVPKKRRSGLVSTTSGNIVAVCTVAKMSMNSSGSQLFLRMHADTWSVDGALVPC